MRFPFFMLVVFFSGILTQEAYAERIYSYNSVSGLLELEGRYLAGQVRYLLVDAIPIVFAICVFVTIIHLYRSGLVEVVQGQQNLVMNLGQKLIFFVILYTGFFFTNGGYDNQSVYSFLDKNDVKADPWNSTEQPKIYPMSGATAYVFDRIDLFAYTIYSEVLKIFVTENQTPFLLQRAIAASKTQNILQDKDIEGITIYRDECRNKFLNQTIIKESGITFFDTFKKGNFNIENLLISEALKSSILTEEGLKLIDPAYKDQSWFIESEDPKDVPPKYKVSCAVLRDNVLIELDDKLENSEDYFDELKQKYQFIDSLTDSERKLVLQQSIPVILKYLSDGIDPGLTDTGIKGSAGDILGWIDSKKHDFLTNYSIRGSAGNPELLDFMHGIGAFFGYISMAIAVASEFFLLFSILRGKIVFVWHLWGGYAVLKFLPTLWVVIMYNLNAFVGLGQLASEAGMEKGGIARADAYTTFFIDQGVSEKFLDINLANDILAQLTAIQNASIQVMTYSLAAVFLIPGMVDVGRRMMFSPKG